MTVKVIYKKSLNYKKSLHCEGSFVYTTILRMMSMIFADDRSSSLIRYHATSRYTNNISMVILTTVLL